MQLGQIASVWMMYDQEERLEAATRHAHDVAPRPSIAQRYTRLVPGLWPPVAMRFCSRRGT